jgi:hypothetical protein
VALAITLIVIAVVLMAFRRPTYRRSYQRPSTGYRRPFAPTSGNAYRKKSYGGYRKSYSRFGRSSRSAPAPSKAVDSLGGMERKKAVLPVRDATVVNKAPS